jgi:hypothetical protein
VGASRQVATGNIAVIAPRGRRDWEVGCHCGLAAGATGKLAVIAALRRNPRRRLIEHGLRVKPAMTEPGPQ